jgi:hypothetical protein
MATELNQVIEWLTSIDNNQLKEMIDTKATFKTLFENASLNPKAVFITRAICGVRVKSIENELTRKVRYLDKLVDELAKGRKMEKILRQDIK